MFSAFGLSGDQNNTTFNGLGSGVSSLPPDAQVRVTFSQFPADPARGGFSGAQINVQSIPGSNFSFRGLSGYGTGPDLQWTDAGRGFVGAEVDDAAFRRKPSRPDSDGQVVLQRVVLGAAHLRRHADAVEHESARSPVGRRRGGFGGATDRDSSRQRRAGLDRQRADAARDRQSQLSDEHRLHAQLVGHGQLADARRVRRLRPRAADRRRRADADAHAGADRRGRGLVDVGVAAALELFLVRRAVADDARRRGPAAVGGAVSSTIRRERCASASQLARRHDVDQDAVIRRRLAAERRVEPGGPARRTSCSGSATNNKHTIKVASSVSREHNTSDVDASLGTFSFNSLADLEAGNAGVVHADALVDSFSERSGHGGRVDRRRLASDEHRPGAVRRARRRQPLSLPARLQPGACATRSAFATTSCRTASTSVRASASSGPTAPRRRSPTLPARRGRRSR